MNKDRRNRLDKLQDRLTAARETFEAAASAFSEELEDIMTTLDAIRDEEADVYDNIKNEDHKQRSEDAMTSMDSARSYIDNLKDTVDNIDFDDCGEAFNQLEEAKGEA